MKALRTLGLWLTGLLFGSSLLALILGAGTWAAARSLGYALPFARLFGFAWAVCATFWALAIVRYGVVLLVAWTARRGQRP